MQTRRFGRTGHMSSVAILGGFVFSQATPDETDRLMELAIQAGVNHIDIAPSYGHAEERVGPWMARERERFFLGCKTMERTREGTKEEMKQSMNRLRVSNFDLYQIHAVTKMEELDQATQNGGALEAMIEARAAGLINYIGITGHGFEAPKIFIEALNRFDFDSVLFPINFVQYSIPEYKEYSEALIKLCKERDVGTMVIKSITKGPWGEKPQTHITWYEPFTDEIMIQKAVDFALSQDITGICTAGDPQVFPKVLNACENFSPMDTEEQGQLIDLADRFEPLFSK